MSTPAVAVAKQKQPQQQLQPITPHTVTSAQASRSVLVLAMDYTVGALLAAGSLYTIARFGVRVRARAHQIARDNARTLERNRDTKQIFMHKEWEAQQILEQMARVEAAHEHTQQQQQARYVEETLRHARHSWQQSKRSKPPHYYAWGDQQQGDEHNEDGSVKHHRGYNQRQNTSALTAVDVAARRTLQLDVNSSDRELTTAAVKAAYKRAVMTAHPDLGGSTEMFRKVTAAYEHISSRVADNDSSSSSGSGNSGRAHSDNGASKSTNSSNASYTDTGSTPSWANPPEYDDKK